MATNEKYMTRCIELARLGEGFVAPNPMVGSVIVNRGRIIGEGFHQKYGEAHAEVNAIKRVNTPELLKESTLYVTMEPCAHHGLTPPCSDLIIEKQIPRVIIGTVDSYPGVAGKGIEKLRKAGVKVDVGMLEKECRELNKRFFTFHEKMRPFIILKWAQTMDGFIDIDRGEESFGEPTWITGNLALRLVHKIRSREGAIFVGTSTAEKDNPSLTLRHWSGNAPLRAVIDKNLRLSANLKIFSDQVKTLVFNAIKDGEEGSNTYIKIDFGKNIIPALLAGMHQRNVLSVIIEGGRKLIESFIMEDLWDEAHIFVGDKLFFRGVEAPRIRGKITASELLDYDRLFVLSNSP